MRVTHVIISNGSGGAERVVVDTAIFQAARGYRVRVLAARNSVRESDKRRLEQAGCLVELRSRHRFSLGWLRDIARASARSEVVHAHLFPAFYFVALSAAPTKVLTEHSPTNNRRQRRLIRLLENALYTRYARVICVSREVQRALQSYAPRSAGRTVVVYNGVPPGSVLPPDNAIADSSREYSPTLMVVGNLEPRKQFHVAIDALRHLPRARLVIIGDGSCRPDLELQASRIAPGRVSFLGYRDNARSLMALADILLVTSEYEGFGMVAVEAMSVGVPVVANEVPGLDEVVREGGVLYGSGRSSLCEAIAHVMENHAAYCARALTNAQAFSLERTLDSLDRIYRGISHAG